MSHIESEYVRKPLPKKLTKIGWSILTVGIILLAVSYAADSTRASFNTIIAFMFVLSIGLGSLFIVALEYLAGAVWSVPLRRIAEILAAVLFAVPLLAIPLVANMHELFHWTHLEAVANDHLLQAKSPYLNQTFFFIRTIAVFVIMFVFYWLLAGRSFLQDKAKSADYTKKTTIVSAFFMPVFAICLTVMSIDWVMSLEAHWFSTIFGVYYFAGSFIAALSALTFAVIKLNENGYLHSKINKDHYYNLGALMFAFTNFWAYIGFSQFLLIWYSNIPEETFWFINKWQGSWAFVSVLLIIVRFVVPYIALLSQPSKSNPKRLKFVAVWMLAAHLLDLYWLVMPTYSKEGAVFSWNEIAAPVAAIGLIIVMFNIFAKNRNLIPVGDPKLKRGLDFHL